MNSPLAPRARRQSGIRWWRIFGAILLIGIVLAIVVTQAPALLANDLVDSDDDGLSDYNEIFIHGSDPFSPHSDSDGIADRVEVTQHGTDPAQVDTDGDGLSDPEEITDYGTDPTRADTDGDGLSDGEEVTEYDTNPTVADTDGDGIDDYGEHFPSEVDTDDDGLTNAQEQASGADPTKADTDDDGLSDAAEVTEYNTDPAAADTDDDGLTDAEEINKYETNPRRADSDQDGLIDGEEITATWASATKYDADQDGYSDYYSARNVANVTPEEQTEFFTEAPTVERIHFSSPIASRDFGGPDSDGDGFPDAMEARNPNLSETTKDVLVRVNWQPGDSPRPASLLVIQDEFEHSPVDDGTGIRLHFYLAGPVNITSSDADDFRQTDHYRQHATGGGGFINAVYGDDLYGTAYTRSPIMTVLIESNPHHTGRTAMHELGHSLGLIPSAYEGIDDRGAGDYQSVMSYSTGCPPEASTTCYGYSSGGSFDDWEEIERQLEAGTVTPTGDYRLEPEDER